MNLSKDIVHFLETAWIPVVEVGAGMLIGPQIKKLMVKMAEKSNDKGILTFFGSAANLLIIGLGFILAAESLGVKMTSVIALISALGLGVALAVRGNMANVAGGLQILMTKPFKVGDYIKTAGHRGFVTTIELMFTTLRSDNGKQIIIPNSTIVDDVITNFTKYPYLRLRCKFSIEIGNDFPSLKTKALELLKANPYLLADKPVHIAYRSLSNSYVKMEAICYVTLDNYERCKQQIMDDFINQLGYYQISQSNLDKIEFVNEAPDDTSLSSAESSKE